jgi:thiamine biosynthesis lipoprotein
MNPQHVSWGFVTTLLALWSAPVIAQERFDFESVQMATKFRISMHAESREKAEKAADRAFERVAALTAIFSDYEPNSELSKLHRADPNVPFSASTELLSVVSRALEISQLTDGAFDITCGHVTRLWRGMRTRKKLPPPERLTAARAAMDWKAVKVDATAGTITLTKPGMLLDLGGIAKGFAADTVLRLLRDDHHITRALVIAGGDIAIGDPPPGQEGWEIKLRIADIEETVLLKNAAVSTSGDRYQSTTVDGQSYAHIISPQTGLGLTTATTCSVIAPNCTTSDALATAFCVLGRTRAETMVPALSGIQVRWAR